MKDQRWNAPVLCWSGLGSGSNYNYQEGLREVCDQIGDAYFHPTSSGYADWDDAADWMIEQGNSQKVLIGHSNGVYAITKIAEKVKPHGIKCYICCFDQTLKSCPRIGSNVPDAIDLWAGLDPLKMGDDFTGTLTRHDFSYASHVGVIGDPEAQKLAVDFGKKWKNH